jgi:hypothetical protein
LYVDVHLNNEINQIRLGCPCSLLPVHLPICLTLCGLRPWRRGRSWSLSARGLRFLLFLSICLRYVFYPELRSGGDFLIME